MIGPIFFFPWFFLVLKLLGNFCYMFFWNSCFIYLFWSGSKPFRLATRRFRRIYAYATCHAYDRGYVVGFLRPRVEGCNKCLGRCVSWQNVVVKSGSILGIKKMCFGSTPAPRNFRKIYPKFRWVAINPSIPWLCRVQSLILFEQWQIQIVDLECCMFSNTSRQSRHVNNQSFLLCNLCRSWSFSEAASKSRFELRGGKKRPAAFAGAIREFPRPRGFASMETLQLHVQQVSGLNMLLEVQTDTSIREVKKKLKDWQKSHLDCIDCLEFKPVFYDVLCCLFKIWGLGDVRKT